MNQQSCANKGIQFFMAMLLVATIGCQNGTRQQKDELYNPNIPDDYSELTDIHHYRQWGVYNVHDPSVIKAHDGYYYAYSTDAIYWPSEAIRRSDTIAIGNIQVRRSSDLVHWEFMGWALDSIPEASIRHIEEASGGRKPRNIWAPYILRHNNTYRLYYSVSIFGANTSYIGLATSKSPMGPWELQGAVVKTFATDPVNAIDPSVVIDPLTNRHWMHYGSYFGGLYCLELNPETGLALEKGDLGKCVARRAEGKTRIIEAPEIIYNPELKKYYYFVSYEPLFTHYNVRVGRSDNPDGPFYDFHGNDMVDTTNNLPVITYAYRFEGHPGWAGVGHCAVINDNGRYFMMHQGRLAPDNLMMIMHTREIFWTPDGWPVVSPQRYVDIPKRKIRKSDVIGVWEEIELKDVYDPVQLWQGQIPPGGWQYDTTMFNNSVRVEYLADGRIQDQPHLRWSLKGNHLEIANREQGTSRLMILSNGWDWENSRQTIVSTGLAPSGYGVWGKKIGGVN